MFKQRVTPKSGAERIGFIRSRVNKTAIRYETESDTLVIRYRVNGASDISLYTSFECQVKCTSNLEAALSVTVHRITVQVLIAPATVQLLK